MRLTLMLLALAGISACAAPALQSNAPALQSNAGPAAAAVDVAFDVPMDPGSIRCQQLTNPNALAAATEWGMGQARANVLSGRASTLPDQTVLAGNIAAYCAANGGETIRTAVAQLGV